MHKKILKTISIILVFLIIFSTSACGARTPYKDNINNSINNPSKPPANDIIIDTDLNNDSDTNTNTEIPDTETDINTSTESKEKRQKSTMCL